MTTTEDRLSRFDQISWWDRQRMAAAEAVVVGAGALGNEVIKNLALLGWGGVTVVDHDLVEESNLSRSILFAAADVGRPKVDAIHSGVARITDACRVDPAAGDVRVALGAGAVRRADVVFGCVDNVAARVAIGQLAGRAGRLYIDGGLTTWEGTVRLFNPPDGPCYVCGLTDTDLRDLTLRRSCLAYRNRAAAAGGVATTPTTASAVAALMVQQAVRWLHRDRHEFAVPVGSELRLDMAYDRFWSVAIPANPNCLLHPGPPEEDVADAEWTTPWSKLITQQRADVPITIHLPVHILVGYDCLACGHHADVRRAHAADRRVACDRCGADAAADLTDQIDGTEDWADLSPRATGLPRWTWVEVTDGRTTRVVELGDGRNGDGSAGR